MTTTFRHTFEPSANAPKGTLPDLPLSPQEIENAGLLEVLQTPGVAMGTWSILDALLDQGNSEFVFKEELGRAREVKVAVSGLFGRFVARAYSTKYLRFTHFSHIGKPPMTLAAPFNAIVDRVPGKRGDMPDWVAWSPTAGHAIIEAKGTHDAPGPGAALARAYGQAERAQLLANGQKLPLKRYAIATRWGFATGPFHEPMLAVRDPDDPGENVPQEARDAAALGVVRRHLAGLMGPLGLPELAAALQRLTVDDAEEVVSEALGILAETTPRSIVGPAADDRQLIGGFVAKGGPLSRNVLIDRGRQDQLIKLDLRPTFVGVEYAAMLAAIHGDLDKVKALAGSDTTDTVELADAAQRDRSATWVVRLEADGNRIG